MIHFNPETHRYAVDGIAMPGVNEILEDLKIVDMSSVPPGLLQAKAELGTAVHLATELDDQGILDEETVDIAVLPYIQAWRQFKADHEFIYVHSEKVIYSIIGGGYCGTVDRICGVDGKEGLVDIKTGGVYRCTRLQTAAYSIGYVNAQRFVVYLKDDESYCLKEHEEHGDDEIWKKCVELFHWKHPRYKKKVDTSGWIECSGGRACSDPWDD